MTTMVRQIGILNSELVGRGGGSEIPGILEIDAILMGNLGFVIIFKIISRESEISSFSVRKPRNW